MKLFKCLSIIFDLCTYSSIHASIHSSICTSKCTSTVPFQLPVPSQSNFTPTFCAVHRRIPQPGSPGIVVAKAGAFRGLSKTDSPTVLFLLGKYGRSIVGFWGVLFQTHIETPHFRFQFVRGRAYVSKSGTNISSNSSPYQCRRCQKKDCQQIGFKLTQVMEKYYLDNLYNPPN